MEAVDRRDADASGPARRVRPDRRIMTRRSDMGGEDQRISVTEADVTGFAGKLAAWSRDLTPVEQALLGRLLARAAGAEEGDTAGYGTLSLGSFGSLATSSLLTHGIIVVGGSPQ